MSTRTLLRIILLAAVSITGFAQAAQQQPPKKSSPEKSSDAQGDQQKELTETITTSQVRLPVAVTERSGRFIVDLKKEDFEIYEDKVKQSIENFQAESNLPLDIGLLMDTSNSVKPKLKFQKEAAISFLQTVIRPAKDKALFLTFNSDIELHQDFTNRIDLIANAVDKVKAYGETRLYDAIYRVCEEKMATQAGRRRAIVLITDGQDTASEHTLSEAINMALKTETVVFVISNKAAGFFGVQAGQVDSEEDKDLKRLSEETGGRAFFTGTVLELERGFASVTRELRSQYLITYEPLNVNFDGKFRAVEVRVVNRKDLKIRTRKGYPAIAKSQPVAAPKRN